MGNSSGSYQTTPERTFAAFDKLPRNVREALANAAFDWAAQPVLTTWRRSRGTPADSARIAAAIPGWDARHIAKTRKRVWGIDDKTPQRIGRKRRAK